MTEAITSVLLEAFERGGFTTRSDFARICADHVAVAACEGLISTLEPSTGDYGRTWRLTPQGLRQLYSDKKLPH